MPAEWMRASIRAEHANMDVQDATDKRNTFRYGNCKTLATTYGGQTSNSNERTNNHRPTTCDSAQKKNEVDAPTEQTTSTAWCRGQQRTMTTDGCNSRRKCSRRGPLIEVSDPSGRPVHVVAEPVRLLGVSVQLAFCAEVAEW